MSQAPQIKIFLACEGNNDKAVLEKAAERVGVAVIVEQMGGEGGLKNKLEVVAAGRGLFDINVGAFGVLLDADGCAKAAEDNASKAMREVFGGAGDFPHGAVKPLDVRGRPMKAGVFIMPGGGRSGALETMILDFAREQFPTAMECVHDFRDCVKKKCGGEIEKEDKKEAQALLSAMPKHCLNFIDMIKTGKINIEHPAFAELRNFLLALKEEAAKP